MTGIKDAGAHWRNDQNSTRQRKKPPRQHCCLHPPSLSDATTAAAQLVRQQFGRGAGRDPQLGWAHATCSGAFSPACALADCREQHILGNKTVTDKSKAPTSPPEDMQFWEHPHSQKSKGLGMLIFL